MKTTQLVALELILLLLLAGCANLRVDQACRAGIEKETRVLAANGHTMRYHRGPNFPLLLSVAQDSEQIGDYHNCLGFLRMAHNGRPSFIGSSGNYFHSQNTWSTGQNQSSHSFQGFHIDVSPGTGNVIPKR